MVTDLHHSALAGRDGLAVSRRTSLTASRYRSDVQGKQLPRILDLMASPPLNLIEQQLGFHTQFGGQITVFRAAPAMRAIWAKRSITFSDLTRNTTDEEIVVLKDTRVSNAPAALFEYVDTDYTHQYRAEVRQINAHLKGANIEYHEDAATADFIVDAGDRYLKRHFTRCSFESGGRLYGGFWLPLGKEKRLSNTLINDESVVGLDFEAMGVMLAYATARATPPAGDLYPPLTLPNRLSARDGNARLTVDLRRPLVKKLMSACLFASQPITKWPRGLAKAARGVLVGNAIAALQRAHPAIAPLFFMGLGHSLQFTESEILVDILLRLIAKGVTALPVHDCIVVAESDLDTAHRVMAEVFTFHTGLLARISIERATEQ